jgi:hypothetical protein
MIFAITIAALVASLSAMPIRRRFKDSAVSFHKPSREVSQNRPMGFCEILIKLIISPFFYKIVGMYLLIHASSTSAS